MNQVIIASMIWLLLLSIAAAEVEAPEPSLAELIPQASQRHISTVIESRITRQFTTVPQIEECAKAHPITVEMINDPTKQEEVQKKKLDAANCVKEKLSNVSDEDLEKMSQELGLRQHGLIKSRENRAVANYLTQRFQDAFFVVGKNGKLDRPIMNQKFFFDLYESQLGKSVLLEISNYCLNKLVLKDNSSNRKELFTAIERNTNLLETLADTGAIGKTYHPDEPQKLYENFMEEVIGVGPDGQVTKEHQNRISKIYDTCGNLIKPFCDRYDECSCFYRKKVAKDPNSIKCQSLVDQNKEITDANYERHCIWREAPLKQAAGIDIPEPNIGQFSCHVMARLRGYRTNLTAVNETQRLLDEQYVDGRGFKGGGFDNQIYQAREESIDDLTTLTSEEAGKIAMSAELPEECLENQDSPQCENFIYSADEAAKLANTSASYAAGTQVQVARLKKIASDDEKLKEYLRGKGYLDLVQSLENGTIASDEIVAQAIQRFEAEREASFAELTKEFERKQVAGAINKEDKIESIKKDYKNRQEDFKQLLLFNNVLTSFLSVQRKVGDTFEEAGKNVRGLTREAESSDKLQGLVQLTEGSQLQNNDMPIVDPQFIADILKEPRPKD
jgi:hypothetical protein